MKWPTRTALAWDLTFLASVLTFVAASTHLLPPAWTGKALEISGLLGMMAGRLALSTVGESAQKREVSAAVDSMNA